MMPVLHEAVQQKSFDLSDSTSVDSITPSTNNISNDLHAIQPITRDPRKAHRKSTEKIIRSTLEVRSSSDQFVAGPSFLSAEDIENMNKDIQEAPNQANEFIKMR